MKIKGLNSEQLNYIIDYAKTDKYPMDIKTEEELFEFLDEEEEIERLDEDKHRWWITFTKIIKMGNRYFGFENATSTGDMTPSESGWSRYNNEVDEYEPIETKIITYKIKEK